MARQGNFCFGGVCQDHRAQSELHGIRWLVKSEMWGAWEHGLQLAKHVCGRLSWDRWQAGAMGR